MNLNNNPTTQQLSKLMALCDDTAGHHVLWVSKSGDVNITLLSDLSPIGFEESTPSMALRYETFNMGNSYVGQDAAIDPIYLTRILDDLTTAWNNYSGHGVHYIG